MIPSVKLPSAETDHGPGHGGLPRLGVVSYLAHRRFEPRGIRTRAIVRALEGEWEIDLVAGPREETARPLALHRRAGRFAKYQASRVVALDPVEWWSRRALPAWSAAVDCALLVGYPFSPVVEASRRLAVHGIPFIVDTGDPWAIAAPQHGMRAIPFRRAQAAEERLWEAAKGAILTTMRQECTLLQRFPHLQTLVRPNGFTAVVPSPERLQRPAPDRTLRLGHFGNLYAARVDMRSFFLRLCRSEHWESIVLEQFGGDWNHTLRQLPRELEVRVHDPVPWAEVIDLSRELDLALVVGNASGMQLPSKVIQYLTLPIPRVALLAQPGDDAISDYIQDKPGWLIVGAEDCAVADRLVEHLALPWPPESLAPPASESWDAVGREIARFVSSCLRGAA